MKIMIIGCGKVGFTLARQLSGENHELVLLDHRAEAMQVADSSLDLMCVEGSGASIQTLREAGVKDTELVVAVTGSDELNIVCCLIAKKLGARHTVARIRSPEYYREANLLKREIGLNMIINPEFAAAAEISRILRVPSAFSVESFARGLVELIGFPIMESDGLAGLTLFEYNKKHPNGVLMCAAVRGGEVHVPNGRFVPQVGDKAYMIGSTQELAKFFRALGRDSGHVRSVTALGGSRIATYLTWAVEKVGMKVRIVEQDHAKCLSLSEQLPNAQVIEGDGTDSDFIEAEGLLGSDAFVALTNRDEENLLMAMTAQRHGVKKVIAKMNRPNYIERRGQHHLSQAHHRQPDLRLRPLPGPQRGQRRGEPVQAPGRGHRGGGVHRLPQHQVFGHAPQGPAPQARDAGGRHRPGGQDHHPRRLRLHPRRGPGGGHGEVPLFAGPQ